MSKKTDRSVREISTSELLEQIESLKKQAAEDPSPDIEQAIVKLEGIVRDGTKWQPGIIGNIIAAIITGIVANVIYGNIAYLYDIIRALPIWGTILLMPLLGVVFYWLRSRFRLAYGLVEFILGCVSAINVFIPSSFDYSQLQPLALFQILGGLYIMVRGLDNVGLGLRDTRLEPYWKSLFRD